MTLSALAYGNGDVVEYTYDDLGRVTREEYRENGSTAISRTVTYTYNETGNLSKMTDSKTGMTTTYSYDPLGRLISAYETDGTSKKSSIYSYYDTGNLKSESYLINSTLYKTVYDYDSLNRVTKVQNGDLTSDYGYDIFNRLINKTTSVGETKVIEEYIDYKAPSEGTTSNQIDILWELTDQDCVYYQYAYDDNGRIVGEVRVQGTRNADTEVFPVSTSKKYSTSYSYNPMDWLTQEDNQLAGKTWKWSYNKSGNITSKQQYNPTTGALEDTITYLYEDSSWGDLLTSYDGRTITYDTIGNPLNDGIWNYTWEQGRRLTRMQSSSATWNYTYDTTGLRTSRSNGTTTYRYWYNDSGLLLQMEKGNTVYSFTYDPAGRPVSVTEGNNRYYYVLNQQGDVIGLMNGNKQLVVEYYYDAWGRLLSTAGALSSTLGVNNPLRYRGYVYDTETGLYYLQSRYYNPTWGRFINADRYTAVNLTSTGSNMFSYCLNNPVKSVDYSGGFPMNIRFISWLTEVALRIGLSCATNKKSTDVKTDKTAEALINNIEFSAGIGMGLYGGTTVLDALGVEMGMYVTNWSLVYEDGSFRTTQEAYAGATASVGHLEFGGAESGTKTDQGEWVTTGWFGINQENDVITIVDVAVFAGPGVSISLGFDLGSFLWDVSEIWGF